MPTHIKIDVDGAELDVLKGAKEILASKIVKEIFIEIDKSNTEAISLLKSFGFNVKWKTEKELNFEMLFSK